MFGKMEFIPWIEVYQANKQLKGSSYYVHNNVLVSNFCFIFVIFLYKLFLFSILEDLYLSV